MVGFDDTCFPPLDPETKHKMYGSDWRGLKMAKTEDCYSSVFSNKQMLRSNSTLSDGQQMLSFSISDSKNGGFDLYNNATSGYCTNTGGYGCGGVMNVAAAGVRGPFTPSQWMELEHQALIYKYILANIPVPSNLLFPIKKALDSAGFSLTPSSYGWGGFHLGFSSNTDPEPGRCRRTDGKKWRCARDAVPDQKYCERHINRGRHRSRKPVEGHNGHSASGPTTSTTKVVVTSAKPVPTATVVPGGSGASGLGTSHQPQLKSLQLSEPNPSNSSLNIDGTFVSKNNVVERNQAATDLSMFSSRINLKNDHFSIEGEQKAYNEPSRSEFGLVFSDSLLNPIHRTPSNSLNGGEDSFPTSVHHQFMDEWPKNQLSDNNTQLSISIPISTSDFMSSTSSPAEEKHPSSPLRLSSRQANWVPISWETSMGGPLGEVLHNTHQTSSNECKPSSALNLMTDGWNSISGIASSPNGPLQRMAFGSHSNSSAGSSPRGGTTSLAPLL